MRAFLIALSMTSLALGSEFAFSIASPVAAQDYQAKSAMFVFRTEGCADLAGMQLSATAEGLVRGARHTVTIKTQSLQKPGVYAIFQTWGPEGQWVVNLKGNCGAASAGALVPVGPRGFIRESAKFFPRPATATDIDAIFKSIGTGGGK